VSNTDFVNSGSYFFTDRVVVFGITTFKGFGGSFFTIGFITGFTDTKDFAVISCFFKGAGSFAAGLRTFGAGAGFLETGFVSGFLAIIFFATGLVSAFLGAGLAGFFAIVFAAFFADLALPEGVGFLAAIFPTFGRAGFLVGILFTFF
jgi:hypothetical protein